MQSPERKRKQALLYEEAGNLQKACQTYEEILLADYQRLSAIFNSICIMQLLEDKNLKMAQYYAEKRKSLARLFEMGEYDVYAADLELALALQDPEKNIACTQGMLNSIDSISAFLHSPLYSHMSFKKNDTAFVEIIKKDLLDTFRNDENFAFMKDDPRWEKLTDEA